MIDDALLQWSVCCFPFAYAQGPRAFLPTITPQSPNTSTVAEFDLYSSRTKGTDIFGIFSLISPIFVCLLVL